MSSLYSSGPVCGVDNCPSSQWRSVDGRRICQYGHVLEGDYEFNDEEDEYTGLVTRRINVIAGLNDVSVATQEARSQRLAEQRDATAAVFGKEAFYLRISAMQFVFERQLQWLQETTGVDLSEIGKYLWHSYVERVFVPLDEDYSEESTRKVKPAAVDTLALSYLACVWCKVGVTVRDFIHWTGTNAVPYIQVFAILPKQMRQKMSKQVWSMVDPMNPPDTGSLYCAVVNLANMLELHAKTDLTVSWALLLVQVCEELRAPPELYAMVRGIVSRREMVIPQTPKVWTVPLAFPELDVVGLCVSCLKLWLAAHPELTGRWFKEYQRLWSKMRLSGESEGGISSDMALAEFLSAQSEDMLFWDKAQTHRYLDWFEQRMCDSTGDEDTGLRRLFPIDKTKVSVNALRDSAHKLESAKKLDFTDTVLRRVSSSFGIDLKTTNVLVRRTDAIVRDVN